MRESSEVPGDLFNRALFEDLRKYSTLFKELPRDWEGLEPLVREYVAALPTPPCAEKDSPFHAAVLNSTQAFRVANELIQHPERVQIYGRNEDVELVQSAGLQLLLYAVFLQLREWAEPISLRERLGALQMGKAFSRLAPLRNAAAHQGGDDGSTFYQFVRANQEVEFSSHQAKPRQRIPVQDVVLGAFLYWLVVSTKWLQSQARMKGGPTRGWS